ncbi:hypothetical protein AB0M34_32670 [Nocardia sp. NPDC050193]
MIERILGPSPCVFLLVPAGEFTARPAAPLCNALTLATQERLVSALEARTGADGRADVRIRLLPEIAMSAWRCGAKNWVRAERHSARRGAGARRSLITRITEAFDAVAPALSLTLPDITVPAGHAGAESPHSF